MSKSKSMFFFLPLTESNWAGGDSDYRTKVRGVVFLLSVYNNIYSIQQDFKGLGQISQV